MFEVSEEREQREGTMADYQSLKVYNNVFLFVGLSILGTLVNFDWLVH